jgi:hypothetical protein
VYFNKAIDEAKGKNSAIMMSMADAQVYTTIGDLDYDLDVLRKALKKD